MFSWTDRIWLGTDTAKQWYSVTRTTKSVFQVSCLVLSLSVGIPEKILTTASRKSMAKVPGGH